MSGQQNIAIAKKLLEGIAGGQDPAAIAALFAENLMFEIQGDDGVLPWTGRKTGRRAIADFMRDIRALTKPISFDVEDILASESRAAIVGALRTRINVTDMIVATQFAIVLTIESDVVTRFQMLEDSFDVSRAASPMGVASRLVASSPAPRPYSADEIDNLSQLHCPANQDEDENGPERAGEVGAVRPEGFAILASPYGPEKTMDLLVAAVTKSGMGVLARIDHASAAVNVGMDLRPTEVLVFGNPKAGTPLMQAMQTMGIDLPLRALVWTDGQGKTWLGYNDPKWLAARHGADTGAERLLGAMTAALMTVASEATGG
jgi:uncharacterized protein (DUF302 family)/ketosteroid isomerase-like protein